MRATAAKKVKPEDYILSVLSPEERLDAALKIAKEAFKGTSLSMKDVESAVKTVRRKAYERRQVVLSLTPACSWISSAG